MSFSFAVNNDAHPKLALLCRDSGEVTLYDIRDCKEPFARCTVKSSDSVRGWFRKTQQTPCIKVGGWCDLNFICWHSFQRVILIWCQYLDALLVSVCTTSLSGLKMIKVKWNTILSYNDIISSSGYTDIHPYWPRGWLCRSPSVRPQLAAKQNVNHPLSWFRW